MLINNDDNKIIKLIDKKPLFTKELLLGKKVTKTKTTIYNFKNQSLTVYTFKHQFLEEKYLGDIANDSVRMANIHILMDFEKHWLSKAFVITEADTYDALRSEKKHNCYKIKNVWQAIKKKFRKINLYNI